MTARQMFFFVLMFLSIAFPVAVIFYARIVKPLKLRRRYNIILGAAAFAIVLLAGAATPAASLIARNRDLAQRLHFDVWGGWPYYLMAFVWALAACLFLRGAIVCGARFCAWLSDAARKKSRPPQQPIAAAPDARDGEIDESRRLFLERAKQAATVGAALACMPPVVWDARSRRVIRRVDIAFGNLPKALSGLKIAHLSDIHVGNTMYRDNIADIVRETNALNPDIIVITGDLADGYADVIGSWIDPMRDFHAKYGTYFVTGNHDHMWDARGWIKKIESLGIVHLGNDRRILSINGTPLAIAGAIDARGDRRGNLKSDPEKALEGIAPNIFKIMLVHQPASVDRSLAAGADLVLLGHTHGGQFWPMTYLIGAIHRYARGLYRAGKNGEKAVYVSCGTGYWGPPVRAGVPPEIIDLRLLSENENARGRTPETMRNFVPPQP